MLNNALSILVCWVMNNVKEGRPVAFTHKQGQDVYQVLVQKVPHQEAKAA